MLWTAGGALRSSGAGVVERPILMTSFNLYFGEGNGNPLQCSCLENPRDGGAWWAAVYGVAQSRTPSDLMHLLKNHPQGRGAQFLADSTLIQQGTQPTLGSWSRLLPHSTDLAPECRAHGKNVSL